MIVVKNKSCIEGVAKLHDYLYDMSTENYELLEIYEQIDSEVDSLESDIARIDDGNDYEDELNEMKKELNILIKDFKKLTRTEILDELERIIF